MSDELTFQPFPKIGRLSRDITVTEKVDGTNAQIQFDDAGKFITCSRTRVITPEDDNFGFSSWVHSHSVELFSFLGPGRHFGEWAGRSIQRAYGLDHKRFYLFNSSKYHSFGDSTYITGSNEIPYALSSIGLDCVPFIYKGKFDSNHIDLVMETLLLTGSFVNKETPFMNPEGIVIYHEGINGYFKKTYEKDSGKWNETKIPE